MAYQSLWFLSELPEEIVEIMERSATERYDSQMFDSKLHGDALNRDKRNSQNSWITTDDWIGGFIWHYVMKANRDNFLYNITNIDGENIQFTKYGEGQFYGWHNDAGLSTHYKPVAVSNRGDKDSISQDFVNENCELIRKLSIVIQLSGPDDYEGGNLQLLDESGKSYIVPRKRGTVVVFDSRTQHRVLKVKKGVRKSLVAWAVGPRWK